MPGIAGIYTKSSDFSPEATLDEMLLAMTHRPDCIRRQVVRPDEGLSAGVISLGVFDQPEGQLCSSEEPFTVFLDGEFYPSDRPEEQGMEGLLRAVRKDDLEGLARLRGDFASACLDSRRRRLSLISGKFGLKPLYYALIPGGLVFASELKALLKVPGIRRDSNRRALADLYHFGFVLGDKTHFPDIYLLPPASVLSFDLETGAYELAPYWRLESLFISSGTATGEGAMADVSAAFMEAVNRRWNPSEPIGISLSGGLDSRLILAALGERARGMPSYTLGLPGCRDQILTEKMAQVGGTEHTFLPLQADDLGDFQTLAATLVSYSDGFYHPHESTEKKALDYLAEAPFRIMLRGHAGEVAKASLAYPLQASESLKAMTSRQQVLEFILESANLGLRGLEPRQLFGPEMADLVEQGPRASIEETFGDLDLDLSPADMCLYCYVKEWVRRQVVASLTVFRVHTEVRLPFMDEDFLAALLKLPLAQRYSGEVHRSLTREYLPALAAIADSNTGAPLTAGKARLFVSDKVNAVLRRISLPGFRHYTEYEDWQRRQFRESLEKILFDPRTLDRGLYQPDALKRVFQEHVQGKRSCAKLLGTIAGIELYMRICGEE